MPPKGQLRPDSFGFDKQGRHVPLHHRSPREDGHASGLPNRGATDKMFPGNILPRSVVRLSPFRFHALKLALFSTVLAYLAADLLGFHGPVWHALHSSDSRQTPDTWVARVYGETLTEEQLLRHQAEQNWLSGRPLADDSRRASMLVEMLRGALLRLRTRYNDQNLPDFTRQAAEEVSRLASRARSGEDFSLWLASQGYTRESFTQKVAARLMQAAQLERAIAPFCQVREEDIERHFRELSPSLTRPASRTLRHIFLPTLDRQEEDVRREAESLLDRLQKGEDFAELARQCSQDEHSAPHGGELGVVYDTPSRPLAELPLFGANALPSHQPVLARSRWGWHLLLAGEITPERPLQLDECRESLRTAIISAQRELATRAYFRESLREGFQNKRIKTHVK